jgi:hypothetical protein
MRMLPGLEWPDTGTAETTEAGRAVSAFRWVPPSRPIR